MVHQRVYKGGKNVVNGLGEAFVVLSVSPTCGLGIEVPSNVLGSAPSIFIFFTILVVRGLRSGIAKKP